MSNNTKGLNDERTKTLNRLSNVEGTDREMTPELLEYFHDPECNDCDFCNHIRILANKMTNGTYTSNPKDTTGLGEYSDAQLVKELADRGVMKNIDSYYSAKAKIMICNRILGTDAELHQNTPSWLI